MDFFQDRDERPVNEIWGDRARAPLIPPDSSTASWSPGVGAPAQGEEAPAPGLGALPWRPGKEPWLAPMGPAPLGHLAFPIWTA